MRAHADLAMPEHDHESRNVTDLARAVCGDCGRQSDPFWRGWIAYRVDDPLTDTVPEIGFFCPECARKGAGGRRR